jgi:Na+/H+ antiporter NhaA
MGTAAERERIEKSTPLARLGEFLRLEASGGIILMFAAAAALVLAKSPLAGC